MAFDPTQFGAIPADTTTPKSSFDPSKFGAIPAETPVANAGTANQVAPQPQSLGSSISNGIQSIFPGKQLGSALGNSIFGIGQAIKGTYQKITGNQAGADQSFQNFSNAANENNQNYGKIAGDTANIALTAAAPLVGGGTPGARIAANALLGGGIGASNAISEGKSGSDVLKSTGFGTLGGAAIGSIGEGLTKLTDTMPSWLVKKALPTLKGEKNIQYALDNTRIGNVDELLDKSKAAVNSYGKQISGILEHPQYADEVGKVADAIPSVSKSFPNAQLDNNQISNIIKKVVPQSKTLVDSVLDGTANLAQQNELRQQIDQATKKIFTDNPNVTFNKQVAAELGSFLRNNVKTTAPETSAIFDDFSKEINLRNALNKAANKKTVLRDLIGGVAGAVPGFQEGYKKGGVVGGITGAMAGTALGVAGEKLIYSPSARLITGNIVKNYSQPLLQSSKALKAPLLRGITK